LDEALGLAVGLWGVGPSKAVLEAQRGDGRRHGVGAVAGAVVGVDALGGDAVPIKEGERGVEEGDGAVGALIWEESGEGEAGVIVDRDVEVFPARTWGVIALPIAGDRLNCGHFHDTRGLGMANVYAAWEVGITRFDACLAGIGGCPHAPGASGNVSTEDLVYLFASMGVSTGQDFDRLIALRAKLAQWLEGETLHGSLWRAGLPKTMLTATA